MSPKSALVLFLVLCGTEPSGAAIVSAGFDCMSKRGNSVISFRESTVPLAAPIFSGNSVEICFNSRYSAHSLSSDVDAQQLSNVLWATGRTPITGSYRNIYFATQTGTYLYDPISHARSGHSTESVTQGAFAVSYETETAFDAGLSYMPALLASVSLWDITESSVANCPKGTKLYFGVQEVRGLTTELVARCSVSESESGWLPDPSTMGGNNLGEVLADLKYISSFGQTDLTPQQISQILWAGYGCTPHTTYNGRAGLTVPSAYAHYYLTGTIYLTNEDGVYRYHNRNPSTDLTTRDHRLEPVPLVGARSTPQSDDIRGCLRSCVSGLPEAPCYVVLCLDSSYAGKHYANLETGFVASNMLIQASALGLGCHFKTELTTDEQGRIQGVMSMPESHMPQAVVSIGPVGLGGVPVSISVALEGDNRPDTGWVIPLTVRFFSPAADVLSDPPTYEFNLTTTKSTTQKAAMCQAVGIARGTYDITAVGDHTLMNARRNVLISAPNTPVDLGTLLEGNADYDNVVDLDDYALLSMSWRASTNQPEYDAKTDFDQNGIVNASDLFLLTANWLRCSPVEIPP